MKKTMFLGEDKKIVLTFSYEISHKDAIYSIGNSFSNIVITLYSDRWFTRLIMARTS